MFHALQNVYVRSQDWYASPDSWREQVLESGLLDDDEGPVPFSSDMMKIGLRTSWFDFYIDITDDYDDGFADGYRAACADLRALHLIWK